MTIAKARNEAGLRALSLDRSEVRDQPRYLQAFRRHALEACDPVLQTAIEGIGLPGSRIRGCDGSHGAAGKVPQEPQEVAPGCCPIRRAFLFAATLTTTTI